MTISKDCVHRLIRDVKQIMKHPLTDNGIYYRHDEEDMLKGYAMIIGPEDTPYFGGYYFFEFHYPPDYPYSPPKVVGLTNGKNIRFNPNMYKCGKICVSILNTWHGDQWSACQTITTVLLTLCTLLCKDPLLNEPGVSSLHSDFKKYNEIVEYSNVDIAICDLLEETPGIFRSQMIPFVSIMKTRFLENFNQIMEFVVLKKKQYELCKPKSRVIHMHLYKMTVSMEYDKIVERLLNLHKRIHEELKEQTTKEGGGGEERRMEKEKETETEKIDLK